MLGLFLIGMRVGGENCQSASGRNDGSSPSYRVRGSRAIIARFKGRSGDLATNALQFKLAGGLVLLQVIAQFCEQ